MARSAQLGSDDQPRLKPDTVVAGKYRVERVLGEGGMGIVYSAQHLLLDQRVAIKVLFERAMRDKEAVARFLQEARSAARLQSEHVARVTDIDTLENGLPYIVMEYLEGKDLGEHVERKNLFSPAIVVDYVLQALEAISQAHGQGIIHRDLKPSNLFLTTTPDGSSIIKVLDFGISKPTFGGRVSTLTSSRSVLGSPPYMSPEQVRSPKTVDTRTDIWSIGVLLYELLTGRMPYEGDEVGEVFAAILERDPGSIRAIRPQVPEGLEKVVARCMAKKREDRFSDVAELARALAPFGTGAQAKSIDKISSTLLRAEELSSRRRAVIARGDLGDPTIPDVPGTDPRLPAPELSPTASTVGRARTWLTAMHSTTRTKAAAFAGGGLAAILAVVVLVVVRTSVAPAKADAPPHDAVSGALPPAAQPDPAAIAAPQPGAAVAAAPDVASSAAPAPPPTTTSTVKARPRAAAPRATVAAPRAMPPPTATATAPSPPRSSPVKDDGLSNDIRSFSR